jgi:hypothetical protein
MNVVAIELVARTHHCGSTIQNDGGKGRYVFNRNAKGEFVRRYENLDVPKEVKGKTVFPEMDRFNVELGDLIEGRRAWPTTVRFITADVAKDTSPVSTPPKSVPTQAQSVDAAMHGDSGPMIERIHAGGHNQPTLLATPLKEDPDYQLAVQNAATNQPSIAEVGTVSLTEATAKTPFFTLKKIAKDEGVSIEGLKGCEAVAKAINEARALNVRFTELAAKEALQTITAEELAELETLTAKRRELQPA